MSNGSDHRRLVKPGDALEIPALAWNRHQAAADWVEAQQNKHGVDSPTALQEGLVRVKNNSGAARKRFEVLGIDSLMIAPSFNLRDFQTRPALSCISPASAHAGKFVVLRQSLAKGAMGWAWLFGYCQVKIQINSAGDTAADVKAGDPTQLNSGGSGIAQIIAADPKDITGAAVATGTHWCIIRFGGAGGSLTRGQYQGMFYGNQTDNQSGFSIPFLVDGV